MLLYNKRKYDRLKSAKKAKTTKNNKIMAAPLAAAGIAAAGSALASGIGKIGARYKKKIQAQEEAQMRLNEQNAELNYQYGENAAMNAHQRSLGLLKAETEANSFESQVADAKAAGLSPGLLYGGAGGGGGASAGGGAMGSGARGQSAEAPDHLAEEEYKLQAKALAVDIQRAINETRKVRAEKEQIEAETENIKEQTETSKTLSPLEAAKLNEEGFKTFIENAVKQYELSGGNQKERDFPEHIEEREELGWNVNINPKSFFTEERAAQVAEAIGKAKGEEIGNMLKEQEAKIAWRKLLLDEVNGESKRAQEKAIELAAKWGIGEYTNWKTWISAAREGIGALNLLIK